MFKLAVFTDEVSQDPNKIVAFAKEFGLDGVELRSIWDTPPHKLSPEQIAEFSSLLKANNLAVAAISSPFLKSDIFDADATAEQVDVVLANCITLAKKLDTRLIRGFTYWRTQDTPQVWQEVERVYRAILPKLEENDVYIMIENEPDTSAATAALTASFLAKLNHPRVRAVWDPANEVYAVGGEKPYPTAYDRVKSAMIHVHVKDALHDPDGKPRCVRIGEGEVNWPKQLQGLAADGYQSWISLETHWRPVDLTNELIRQPGGKAYSESAEEASRLCMTSLKQMLAGLSG
jgi:L-ribulose-5-phosphate 3-epimerase